MDLRRGAVRLELEKNSLQRDDAVEVLETLTSMAESYGWKPPNEDGDDDDDGVGV